MYELASTAYSLVIESPGDAHRWRALAKLDSYADGSSRWVTRTPAKRLCRGIHICSTIVRGSARCQITIGETTPRHLTMRCSQPWPAYGLTSLYENTSIADHARSRQRWLIL